jgi:hypothetical protein
MSFLFAPASSSTAPNQIQESSSSSPPTKTQKAALHAVAKGSGKGMRGKNAKRGKIIAKFFNDVAGRPFAPLGSLEQSISVSLEFSGLLLTTQTVAETYVSHSVLLSGLNGYFSYTSLFDQYRIDFVEMWVEPQAAQGTTVFGQVATAVDLDDANSPTSMTDVSIKPGALYGAGGAGRYHKWQPHMAVAVYS